MPAASDGGYLQAAYTFKGGWWLPNPLTVGGSWGVSHLETAGPADNFYREDELRLRDHSGARNGRNGMLG